MSRPSVQEFLRALLEGLEDLPPDVALRLEALLNAAHLDRAQAIRQLFEELAGD